MFAFAIFSAWAKVLSLKSGTFTETLVSFSSVYKTIIEFFGMLDPGFGVWSVTRVEFLSPLIFTFVVNPACFNNFSASVTVLFLISGTVA